MKTALSKSIGAYGSRMKLSQKMVFIVAVPLLFELVIFSTIWMVVNKAEAQAQSAENATFLVTRSNAITNEIYAAGGSLAGFIATKNSKFEARFNEFVSQAEGNLQEMDKVSLLSERQRSIFIREQGHVKVMLDFLKNMHDQVGDASSHSHLLLMHNQRKKAQDAAQNYMDNMHEVMTAFETEAKLQRRELTASKAMVMKVIATGMILSLLLALVVSLGFARHIIQQMQLLSAKAHKLVTFEELGEPASGSDEISQLDRTFHDVANLLAQNAQKEKQLEQMKRTIFAMVSHDLRSPLTSTLAFLGLLSDGSYGPLNGQGRLTLRAVENSLGHVGSLVDDMLSLSSDEWKQHANQRCLTDVGALISEAVDIVAAAAKLKDISIVAEQFPDAYVMADETRLIQVLVNIMSNSIKYCPAGSTITVLAHVAQKNCSISICDDGPGISVPEVFAPFVRGRQEGPVEGRGLGLFLSKQVVESHGGTIVVDKTGQPGARFDILLPLIDIHTTYPISEAKAS